ncbi:o-succinylbenzoate--CoA ligase [Brenneria roseae subsp. americana]|uniref:O-succinylbenzoate--CoA ligase n=1 Tax=Brenneria roseae subsp. americana TaxID=1508507 RepID=A0A2U1TQP0_9GAMM|nr:class I adenylate-forming enzyme family protein [Brenneria roseae]PWC11709.1 o-succinylbenzoate--CoA ligase [Brenneria roseae subsp. americana]
MINGKDLWNNTILRDMGIRKIHNRNLFTYLNMPKNFYETLVNTVSRTPDKIAFYDNWGRAYSYVNFLESVDKFSLYLKKDKKIHQGSHVGILLYNSIEFCIAFYAIAKLGAIAVPLPTKYRETELTPLVDKSNLDILIINEDFNHYFQHLINKDKRVISEGEKDGIGFRKYIEDIVLSNSDSDSVGDLSDEIIIMFTSGTTSQSKGVVLRNYNVIHAIITYQRILDIAPEDKTIIPIPIYHITGLVALLGLFVYVGGEIHLYRYYDAKRILEGIVSNEITFMHGSPTVFSKLLDFKDENYNLKSLRILGCGSSYTPLAQQQAFHQWLPHTKFIVIYGMTETSSPAFIFPNDTPTSIYATASGKPIPGIEVKILDEAGLELPHNQIGEIWLRGSVVCEEYYQLDSSLIDNEFWLNTGDMGYSNEDNYIYVVDRKKDMINRGGEKIWTNDVEQELLLLKEIKDCAVVGIPDEVYGEVAAAIIVLKTSYKISVEEIKSRLKKSLATFKIPEKIIFSNEIPKTPGLKVDKKKIKGIFSNK